VEEKVFKYSVDFMPDYTLKDQAIRKPAGLVERIREKPFYYLFAVLVIINITQIIINAGIWLMAGRQGLFITADFTNYYTGFKMVMNGDGSRLYDLGLQASYQQKILGNIIFSGGLLPYVNPPFIAVLFSPLALIPISTAFYVWMIGELGLLIWLIILINKLFEHWAKQERLILIVVILAFWPLTITFMQWQFSLFLLISVLQTYRALRLSKPFAAGFWLSLLIIKPQTLPLIGLMSLNKRFWRVALATAFSCLSIVILSSALLGASTWLHYIQVLQTMMNNFGKMGFFSNFQYTFRGILTNILGYSQANTINMIGIGVFIGGAVIVWLLWLNGPAPDSERFKLYFTFTILLSTFLSLHLYPHDDLILVLPAVLFYDYLREKKYPRKAYTIFLMISPVVFFIAGFSRIILLGFLQPPVLIILILLVWIIYYLVLDHRSENDISFSTKAAREY
jgi:hypothetical protein